MFQQTLTTGAFVVAAICGGCLILMLPAIAGAAFRGNVVGTLHRAALMVVFAALGLAAFAVLGSQFVGYFAAP